MKHHHDHHTSPLAALSLDVRLIRVGAVLVAAGSLVTFTGLAIASYALVSAGRRWTREMDVHPSEQAARMLHQARQASQAGMEAWHAAAQGDSCAT